MEPSKWQKEFHIDSEDRLFSRKPRLLSLRPSMKTLCIFAGAVVAIGVIFYVSQHTSTSIPDYELPTIQAPEKPFKTKPAAQESDQEPLKYKTIYQKLSAKQPDEKVEHLLKEPEDPISHWIQLASLKTREAVEREWKRLTALRNLKPLLKGLKPVYGRVDMGESEGICYRLRVGLFSYENAKILCRKLKEQKVDCIVKKG